MTAEPLCRYHKAQGQIVAATILDHIIALALGGTNDPDNLAPACLDCNTEKAKAEQRYLRAGHDVRFVASDPALGRWLTLAGNPTLQRS
ncbi:HNH endonuclease signature motif containing protein [Sphingomonas faeni]